MCLLPLRGGTRETRQAIPLPRLVGAERSDGKFLWRHDLGWAIEWGIWYSPYLAYDVDGDGKDELVIGAACIDDDGQVLGSLKMGHPDVCYVTDFDPGRPGLEIFYGFETRQKQNGVCLVDARTGQILWGWDKPTTHVHSQGMVADIDPKHRGMEGYAGERDLPDRWLYSAKGELINRQDLGTLAPRAVWWDGDEQKEVLMRGGRLTHWASQKGLLRIEGTVIGIADVVGDWREEILTCVDGELRIYTTTTPTEFRYPCLMQDRQIVSASPR